MNVILRCRAERQTYADRFQKSQCPNRASADRKIDGVNSPAYPVCGVHAGKTANLYKGKGWRRAWVAS